MKNNLIIIFFLIVGLKGWAQVDTLYISDTKFLTVHFPSEVTFYQTNAITDEDIGVNTIDNTVFIQSFGDVEETNIVFRTIDNRFYTFVLKYKQDLKILEKTINLPKEALKEKQQEQIQQEKQTAEIQNENKEIFSKILKSKGYLKTRNYTEKNRISITLKGSYYANQKMYLYFEINNKTSLDYLIDSFNFFISNKKMISATGQKTPVDIVDSFSTIKQNNLRDKQEIIFVLDKFSLADNKKMIFEIIENQGERNLTFSILPQIINNAKTIN